MSATNSEIVGCPWGDPNGFATFNKQDAGPHAVPIKKTDEELRLVFSEVFAPGFPDSQGDFMTAETIRVMAHTFLRNGLVSKVDVGHSQVESGCFIVESFIAREGDPVFLADSWVVGIHVPDDEIWAAIKSGELNGLSLDGFGVRIPTVFEVDIPDTLVGVTSVTDDHSHEFYVRFDDKGNFLGGSTSPASTDGHVHTITRGTVTDTVNGHSHRFSFVEEIVNGKD